MTTDGVDDTTAVTATAPVLAEGLVLAEKTTVCFWEGVVRMEVEPSLDNAALLWDFDRMLGTKLELAEVVTMITWTNLWYFTI